LRNCLCVNEEWNELLDVEKIKSNLTSAKSQKVDIKKVELGSAQDLVEHLERSLLDSENEFKDLR